MQSASITELVSQTMLALQRMGLTVYSTWVMFGHTFNPIIRMHELSGKEHFDRGIVTEFIQRNEERFDRQEITYNHYRTRKLCAQRLTEMHDNGRIEWSAQGKPSKFVLNEYYEQILADFVPGEKVSSKAKSDITWIARKYFAWLIQEGHEDLTHVGVGEVQRFMIYCSGHMASSGIHNAKLYMKKLYRYLADHGYSDENYDGLFSIPVLRGSKLYPAVSRDEIAMTLDMIDQRIPQGKRDYAMILIGAVTGLRAIDIAKMKLSDIDWRKGEIKIVQSKTGKSLALPLTKDIGDAISEYILKARQKSDFDNVFLRMKPPFRPFSNGVAIGDIYDYYRKRTGLPRDAHDGMGFHSLRRSLGKNLVTSGAKITMVAQILGDSDIESTKKYISLDSEHLKECALCFTGIKPKRGVMSL